MPRESGASSNPGAAAFSEPKRLGVVDRPLSRAMTVTEVDTSPYRDAAAYGVSSLRMIFPPFITNLTR
jgi:hypothetical protein